MATTVRSTTGTAPIVFDLVGPDLVLIVLEDGSQQLYKASEIIAAISPPR
ncbi:hypothetical protein ACTAQJ_08010 [Arthrobacter sp. alpha11c]